MATPDVGNVVALLDADISPEHALLYRPRYNIAPTDQHWMFQKDAAGTHLVPARFGTTLKRSGQKPRLLLNAREESLLTNALFRHAMQSRRCVVPFDGFYEWQKIGKERLPTWFHNPDSSILLMAGLILERQSDEAFPGMVVVTTEANEPVASIHDRMPVILDRADALTWLAEPKSDILRPYSNLVGVRVSSRVNKVAHDDASCLAPAPTAPTQQMLF